MALAISFNQILLSTTVDAEYFIARVVRWFYRGSTVQIGTNIKISESGLLFRIVIASVITKVTQ
jgi:hypothetical protein